MSFHSLPNAMSDSVNNSNDFYNHIKYLKDHLASNNYNYFIKRLSAALSDVVIKNQNLSKIR